MGGQSDRIQWRPIVSPVNVIDILPPSGLKRLVGLWLETVAIGVRRLRRGAEDGHRAALTQVNLLTRLLRIALLILAMEFELSPLRPRMQARGRNRARPNGALSFRLFPGFSIAELKEPEERGPVPDGFADAGTNARLSAGLVAKRLAVLARVLANPRPVVAQMARRLPRQLMVMGPRPAQTMPPGDAREILEALRDAWREGWFQLHDYRRRTRDKAACPASAA